MARNRNWVFTLNADDDAGEGVMWLSPGVECPVAGWLEKKNVLYMVCQVESATQTGKVHVQGYMQLHTNCSLSALKKALGDRAHFEVRRGTHAQARAYCMKAETRVNGPWEFGEPKDSQGKRTDLETVGALVKQKKTNLQILEEVGPNASKFSRHITFMRFCYTEADSDRQVSGVRVVVLYGTTGVGKTYAAVNYIAGGKDYYICQAPSHPNSKVWFDGYEGQHTLILDDFSGAFCDYRYLLRLLDCYKFTAEVKGGFVWGVWTTVVITTNVIPSAWYVGVNLEPLERRITEIRFCERQGEYQRMTWNERLETPEYFKFVK